MDQEAQGGAAATRGGLSTRWVELIVALLICLGGAIVVFDSVRIGAKWASDGPESGYFPFLTGACLLLSGAWIAGAVLVRWKRLASSVFVEWTALKPVLEMLLPTIAFVVAIKLIGIYVASAIFIGAFMVWKGRYRWPLTVSVSLCVPVAMFLLFEVWFLVPLPKGPLENMLGY
ncbi:hypothetical protein BURK1_03053 [Burkholderiales bacterium]|nr:hypothetical protein BURK1_03053 [Burkholderiales bacterium]